MVTNSETALAPYVVHHGEPSDGVCDARYVYACAQVADMQRPSI